MQSSERKSKIHIQIEGPFFTMYSLAQSNRVMALLMDKMKGDEFEITYHATRELTDYMPTDEELEASEIGKIFEKEPGTPDYVFRNMWPHDLTGNMTGKYNFAYFAWEESLMLEKSVELFNKHLDGLIVASNFVKDLAIRSGITIPIEVISNGILPYEDVGDERYSLPTKKRYKFFHNSSGLARKGADVLLKSYFHEFTKDDDVVLVIKTYPAPDNNIPALLAEWQSKFPNGPEVVLINDKLSAHEMNVLYQTIDCVVLPTRCEGFGLPQAEALHARKPLITTGYSGQMDFCHPDNCWLIDYTLVPSTSHLARAGSVWAEPSAKDLQIKMRHLYENYDSDDVKKKVENGYELIHNNYMWEHAVEKFFDFVRFFEKVKTVREKNITVFSTWNTKCGVAKYSRELYTDAFPYFNDYHVLSTREIPVFPDTDHIKRFWLQMEYVDIKEYEKLIDDTKADLVHIQHHSGQFSLQMLCDLISHAKEKGKKVFATFHSLEEFDNYEKDGGLPSEIIKGLNEADILYVHKQSDFDYLKKKGLNNLVITTIGNFIYNDEDRYSLRKALGIESEHVIAAHGFLLPHKNFHKIIQAVKNLKKKYPDIVYMMVTATHSTNEKSYNYYLECLKQIEDEGLQKNVVIFPNFLSLAELVSLLHVADMIILPYGDTKESASAAIRNCIEVNRPILVSDSGIFDEAREYSYTLKSLEPESIAKAVEFFYEHPEEQAIWAKKATDFVAKNTWSEISKQYLLDVYNVFNK